MALCSGLGAWMLVGSLTTIVVGPEPAIASPSPQPGEPAIAPARVEGEPAVQRPEPASPMPAPGEGELPAADAVAAPVEGGGLPPGTDAPSEGAGEGPSEAEGGLPTWESPAEPGDSGAVSQVWEEDEVFVKPPSGGVGLYGIAGVLFGTAITKQWVMAVACTDDAYCGGRGIIDDFLMFGTIGFAGAGGWKHGELLRWKAEQAGRAVAVPKARRITGWTLFAVGMSGLIVDMGLYNACYSGARGPYTQLDGFRYTCSTVTSVLITDFSGLTGAVGAGLGLSAERQIRPGRKVDVSIAPSGGRGRVGLSLSGRF